MIKIRHSTALHSHIQLHVHIDSAARQLCRFGGHAHAVSVRIDGGQVFEDGQMSKPQLACDRHGEEEVSAFAAGNEIHILLARRLGHQVDELGINRAGCELLVDFGVDLVIERELIACAGFLDDGEERVCRRFTAVEELGVDVERPELSGRIPERMTFGADADGVGFKQPGDDRVFHSGVLPCAFIQSYIIRYSALKWKEKRINFTGRKKRRIHAGRIAK